MPIEQDQRGQTGVMVEEGHGVVFWLMLKNGHTAYGEFLRRIGFRYEQSHDNFDTTPFPNHFAFIRDPFGRYISALAQVWRQGHVADIDWEPYIEGIDRYNQRKPGVWTAGGNAHFRTQESWLRWPNRHHCDVKLFRLGNHQAMADWLDKIGITAGYEPEQSKNRTDKELIDYAKKNLDRSSVEAYYAHDLELWQLAE